MDNQFPPALRLLGPVANLTGAADSLQAINTFELPDGALCTVTFNNGLYVLAKASTAAAVTGGVIVPAAGPGRWLLLSLLGGEGMSSSASLSTPIADFAIITNTWTALSGADFAEMSASPLFTLSATTGRLTYNGPSGMHWELSVEASIGNHESGAAVRVAVAMSKNGDVSGSASPVFEQNSATNATVDVPTYIHSTRVDTLAHGDTIDPLIKNITAGDLNLFIQEMVILARPVY